MLGIAIALLITWPVGYFFALMVTGGLYKKPVWAKVLQALLGLVLGALILWVFHVSNEWDAREYNNGICTVCGGKMEFSGAAGQGTARRHYYYTCAECDHTIQVESLQK